MVAAVVLVCLLLMAGLSRELGAPGAGLLAAVSLLWLLVNTPMEGPTLLTVTHDHGVTGADLAGFAGLVLAVVRVAGAIRASRRGTDAESRLQA